MLRAFTTILADHDFRRSGGDSWRVNGAVSASLGPFIGLNQVGEHVAWYARVGLQVGFGGAASGMGDLAGLATLDLRGGAVF